MAIPLDQYDVTLLVGVVAGLALLLGGVLERVRHQRRLHSIALRINVNGSRGKSTVTRLITGMLWEAGYRTAGKTTGTAARLILGDEPEEEPVKRRPEGPNIREQKVVTARVVDWGAQALVSECMAVLPEYQTVFQRELLQANVAIITNVLSDHLREMGPTRDEVAEAFSATIPNDGTLLLTPGPYVDYFSEVAGKRGTKVLVAEPARAQAADLVAFEHLVFPEHIALTLTLADHLGIDEQTALAGMKRSRPDPFATRIVPIGTPSSPAYFVNAFPANDPASTLGVWNHLRNVGHSHDGLIVVMNCRADRWDRTEQFAEEVLGQLDARWLVCIGELVAPILRAHEQGKLGQAKLLNLEGQPPAEVYSAVRGLIDENCPNQVVFGVGNLHHAAVPLIEAFEADATSALVPNQPEGALDVRD